MNMYNDQRTAVLMNVGDVNYFFDCIRLGGFNVGWNIVWDVEIANYDVKKVERVCDRVIVPIGDVGERDGVAWVD